MFKCEYKSYVNGTGKWEEVATYDFDLRTSLVLMSALKADFEDKMGECGDFRLVPVNGRVAQKSE